METAAAIVSYASGFALMRYRLSPGDLFATSLTVNLALGSLTAVIVSRRRLRNRILWTALGFSFGLWALAAVLLLGSNAPKPDGPPTSHFPTSRAA